MLRIEICVLPFGLHVNKYEKLYSFLDAAGVRYEKNVSGAWILDNLDVAVDSVKFIHQEFKKHSMNVITSVWINDTVNT